MSKDKPSEEKIAYLGRTFTIEWYCDASGYSQPREFAESLDVLETLASEARAEYRAGKTLALEPDELLRRQ